eukprot:maker-scaffold_5-snap-gene-5.57-mRNA-1 protein AED:0.00 eAED:0.00 QI:41/1/1/1/1/1/2/116/259
MQGEEKYLNLRNNLPHNRDGYAPEDFESTKRGLKLRIVGTADDFEKELKENGNTVEIWTRYLSWNDKKYLHNFKNRVPLYDRALEEINSEGLQEQSCYVELWLRRAIYFYDTKAVLKVMRDRKIGLTYARYYREVVKQAIRDNQWKLARLALEKGISAGARPIKLLEKTKEKLDYLEAKYAQESDDDKGKGKYDRTLQTLHENRQLVGRIHPGVERRVLKVGGRSAKIKEERGFVGKNRQLPTIGKENRINSLKVFHRN